MHFDPVDMFVENLMAIDQAVSSLAMRTDRGFGSTTLLNLGYPKMDTSTKILTLTFSYNLFTFFVYTLRISQNVK